MGNTTSKRSSKEGETKNKIPSDSPLGHMLKYWPDNRRTKGKKKQQMITYCCFIWTQGPILKPAIFWPKFGSDKDWVCQLLTEYVNDKSLRSQEETEYALCWRQGPMVLFPLKLGKGDKSEPKETTSK
jgi:hypothetical protein